jgi:hypothetical protein
MSKKIQLSIPTPCHENWNNMTPVQQGKFCASCQKQVTDFSNMSDREIAQFFKKPSTGSVCGRFMEDQLDRSIEIPKKRIPWVKYFFQITIPIFLANFKSSAQRNVVVKENKTTICAPSIKGEVNSFKSFPGNISTDSIPVSSKNSLPAHIETAFVGFAGMVSVRTVERIKTLNGRVIDENGEGIAYATVAVKGTKSMTACDSVGNFAITCKNKKGKITLVSSCVGFVPVEKQVDLVNGTIADIILTQDYTMSGEVVVTGYTGRHRMGLVGSVSIIKNNSQKQIKEIKNNHIYIYPNPVKLNSSLNIKWEQSEVGSYSLQLFNLSGQLMFTKEMYIDDEARILNLQLPSVSPGNYFLRMINKQSGKSSTEKIIMQ